jgi:hypothetical protein
MPLARAGAVARHQYWACGGPRPPRRARGEGGLQQAARQAGTQLRDCCDSVATDALVAAEAIEIAWATFGTWAAE